MAGEFDLIQRYFAPLTAQRKEVILGIGDDCALLSPPAGKTLAITTDTLVSGVHFFSDVDPCTLGHKALAVNLSDLAAMGATPAWVSLALTLPNSNESWLAGFSQGFRALANQFKVQLIGGDTTQGPLSITLQAMGYVEANQALTRSGAKPGDAIFVSGTLGDAGFVLRALQGQLSMRDDIAKLRHRLETPQPRVQLGQALCGLASSCIDLSDGLAGDLGHICTASSVGATVWLDALPVSESVQKAIDLDGDWSLALNAGDDYELCFTLAQNKIDKINQISRNLALNITQIGEICSGSKVDFLLPEQRSLNLTKGGFEHFS